MSTEESFIYNFLKRFPNQYFHVSDISQNAGPRQAFKQDPSWALPVLRRMELDGWVESSPFGEYRMKHQPDETTTFKQAIQTPGMPLGDTAIITLEQVGGKLAAE